MSPRSLLFFFFIIIIDIILKSIKDKRKIEEARRKRNIELNNKQKYIKDVVIKSVSREPVEKKPKLEKKETISKAKPLWEESSSVKLVDIESKSLGKGVLEEKRTKKYNKQIKKDIIRGIIYSEILSEPISLRRKSM